MAIARQPRKLMFDPRLSAATAALAIVFMLIVAATQPAQAQTFNVLYNFTDAARTGKNPYAGLTMDKAGNLYGTAFGRRPLTAVIVTILVAGRCSGYRMPDRVGCFTPLYHLPGGR